VAINLLLLSLEERAKKLNKKFMYALVKNNSLINVYKEQGYKEASSYTTELIKKI
jgi:tRNA 2-selenouridine synthase SelU